MLSLRDGVGKRSSASLCLKAAAGRVDRRLHGVARTPPRGHQHVEADVGAVLRSLAVLGLAVAAALEWAHDVAGARTAIVETLTEHLVDGITTP